MIKFMGKKRVKFSDEIRQAIEDCGLSRYAICQALDIKEAQMSRFMADKGWLGQQKLNALADLLGLRVAVKRQRKK
jgi:hypothetical protein